MAGGGGGEKTEKATPKKRRDEREQGNVLRSQDMSTALMLIGTVAVFKILIGNMGSGIMDVFYEYMPGTGIGNEPLTILSTMQYFQRLLLDVALILAPLLGFAMLAGVVVNLLQTGFLFTTKTLKLKPEKINPISGAKRMFSSRAIVELLKSLAKISIILIMSWNVIYNDLRRLPSMMGYRLPVAMGMLSEMLFNLAFRACAVLIILALFDYLYQWWKFEKDLKMTKQEIKDEYKLTEGNPEVKGKIKQIQRQMGMLRMMSDVSKADVVVTNPTHYAIALRYDTEKESAPIVLAKGKNFVAQQIKKRAAEHNIITVENRPLAQALYAQCKIGHQIPLDMYQAVAEILVYVAKVKGGQS